MGYRRYTCSGKLHTNHSDRQTGNLRRDICISWGWLSFDRELDFLLSSILLSVFDVFDVNKYLTWLYMRLFIAVDTTGLIVTPL